MLQAKRSWMFALVGALLLVFTACGDKSADDTSADGPGSDGGGDTSLTVVAKDFSFDQDSIDLPAGATVEVTFDNQGESPHTFSSDDITGLDVAADPGQTVSGSFTVPADAGTYEFYCKVHPDQMSGEIVVGGTDAGGGSTDTTEGTTDSTEDTGEGDSENDNGTGGY